MDLIGASLKYEMDLRDLRAAENMAATKLMFFFGPQVRARVPAALHITCISGQTDAPAGTASSATLSPQRPCQVKLQHNTSQLPDATTLLPVQSPSLHSCSSCP